jgi:catechol 2,3-dioxygenase-like lactoylglutathione lyase family enzyme
VEVLPVDQQVTFLYTRDLEKTVRFYEEVMGFPLVRDQGDCRIYRVSHDGFLGFCLRDAALEQPEGIILTIITPEVDAWYERLKARGVDFERPPADNPDYRIYHCFLRDPSGYLIEIQRFWEPLE